MHQLGHRRAAVVAVVASAYAAVFVMVAAVLLVEFATGTGAIGHKHLTGTAKSGVVELSVLLLIAAGVLSKGVLRLRRRGDARLIAWPLAVLTVVGIIGEIADLTGTASGTSNAIGAGIIVLAAIPVCLIVWKKPKPGP